jgi:hypothetical protein
MLTFSHFPSPVSHSGCVFQHPVELSRARSRSEDRAPQVLTSIGRWRSRPTYRMERLSISKSRIGLRVIESQHSIKEGWWAGTRVTFLGKKTQIDFYSDFHIMKDILNIIHV